MKPKIKTRLWCAIGATSCAYLAVGLPKLDPNNYWLALSGLLFGSVAAGCAVVVTFYEKLLLENNEPD